MTTKDEIKNRISMALKDPILQQGFEIICRENAELKARLFCTKETCDNCGFVKCENFQRQRKSEPCSVYISYKDRITKLKLQLIEAKEIIKGLLELGSIGDGDYTYVAEAEQFLKEAEK